MAERLRGWALQQMRDRILRRDPLCVRCRPRGYVSPSVEVDHKIRLEDGGTNDDDNLQGLCLRCHKEKTKEEATGRGSIGLDGWPIEGDYVNHTK